MTDEKVFTPRLEDYAILDAFNKMIAEGEAASDKYAKLCKKIRDNWKSENEI